MGPLVPYIDVPELVLLPEGALGDGSPLVSVKPFGVLVAAGVFAGGWSALRYGRRRGLSPRALASFITWVVASGFVFAHVFDVLWYTPERVLADPAVMLRLWDGLSSYGGFLGGVLGAFGWSIRHRSTSLPYADVVASGLPLGWIFGRAGCAVVHDHPGIPSVAWFAVAYPDGGRLDLGLMEMVLVIPLAVACWLLQRRAWPWGFFVGLVGLVYAPMRFGLDFLRLRGAVSLSNVELVPDRRYLDLTPAQWASAALAACSAVLLQRALARGGRDGAFLAPHVPAAFREPRSDPNANPR